MPSKVVMFLFLALMILTSVEELSAESRKSKIEFHGDLWVYYQYQDNCYFSDQLHASFAEPTIRLGASINFTEWAKIDLRGVFTGVVGNSRDLTSAEDEIETVFDLWNIEMGDLFNGKISVKIGRQELGFGDGFLIWDGVTDNASVWSNPLRSFYAARATYTLQPVIFDFIVALTEHDFAVYDAFLKAYEGRSKLYGGNVHLEKEDWGSWDLGIFFRNDSSDLENDTYAISLKGEYVVPKFPLLTLLSGEIVKEYGETRLNRGTLSNSTQDRDAWGGHIDITVYFNNLAFSPYVKGSYIYLSGDDPGTSDVEAYDPLFYGWVDWNQWYIGDITGWELIMTNEKVWMLEGGIKLTETTKLRVQLLDFRMNERIMAIDGKKWSQEVNVIADWYPTENIFCGAMFGYTSPRDAAKAFNGDNENIIQFGMWTGVSF